MSRFDDVFERVIGHEGGYSNDPNDSGGETIFGISKRAYPKVNIRDLTLDEKGKPLGLQAYRDLLFLHQVLQSAKSPETAVKRVVMLALIGVAANLVVGVAAVAVADLVVRAAVG